MIPRSPRCRLGFTAIELLIVLIVVLILIGLVVPGLLGALRKGSVNDAANSIVRVSSQARQFARTRALDSANPKYFGMILVAPADGKPTYAALTYGANCPPQLGDILPQPNGNPVCKLGFNANVVVYRGEAKAENDPSVQPLAPGECLGWVYQYRTGYPIYPAGRPLIEWPTIHTVNLGVDPVAADWRRDPSSDNRWINGVWTDPSGDDYIETWDPKVYPDPLRHLTLRTADGRYKSAIAVYQIGLSNVQDM